VESLQTIKKAFLDDTFANLFFRGRDKITVTRVTEVFTQGQNVLSRKTLQWYMGKSPMTSVSFFAPIGHLIKLGSAEIEGPFIVCGQKIPVGALYVRVNHTYAVILLGPKEKPEAWQAALSVPPLSEVMATICKEREVEMLDRELSADHPLCGHLLNTLRVT
jgi:hypothetical protein